MSDHNQAGFTIVELLVTIVVFGFVSLAVMILFLAVMGVQRHSTDVKLATEAAQVEIESLRNNNYNQLTVGQNINFTSSLPNGLPAPKSGTAIISQPTTGIKRVDVTVSYTEFDISHSVQLSSLIGVIGIAQ